MSQNQSKIHHNSLSGLRMPYDEQRTESAKEKEQPFDASQIPETESGEGEASAPPAPASQSPAKTSAGEAGKKTRRKRGKSPERQGGAESAPPKEG